LLLLLNYMFTVLRGLELNRQEHDPPILFLQLIIDDVPLAWTMELKRRAGHRRRMKPVVEAGRLTMAHDFGWFGEWEWERDKRNEIQ
jgi:hypothetical protein